MRAATRPLVALAAAACAAVLAVAAPPPALAHLGNTSYADFDVRGGAVLLRFRYAAHVTPGWPGGEGAKVTRPQVLALQPRIEEWLADTTSASAGGRPCRLAVDNVVGPDRNDDLEVTAAWTCEGGPVTGLRIAFAPLAAKLDEWQTMASLRMDGRSWSTVFTPGATRWIVGDPGPAAGGDGTGGAAGDDGGAGPADEAADDSSTASTMRRFFELGVEHIWTGYDHLLFLLAVLLAGGGVGRLAAIVTSFTVAHSITLGAAATGLVTLPVQPVEIAIALSIVVVAVENILGRGADRRALVTFVFGLVHGFGFASVLSQTALPPDAVVVPLLAFNLGVEAGQLAVVVVVVPVLAVVLRGPHAGRVRNALSGLVGLAGAAWAVERIGAMLGG